MGERKMIQHTDVRKIQQSPYKFENIERTETKHHLMVESLIVNSIDGQKLIKMKSVVDCESCLQRACEYNRFDNVGLFLL